MAKQRYDVFLDAPMNGFSPTMKAIANISALAAIATAVSNALQTLAKPSPA